MIDAVSISDNQVELVQDKGLLINWNELTPLPSLSSLRRLHGNSEEVVSYYKRTTAGLRILKTALRLIDDAKPRFVAFHSEEGLYRSPAMADLVAQELCELGYRVLLSHYRLPVPAEELIPTRRSWGEYNS